MSAPAVTVLIVDDEAQNRKLLETMLRREGYETLSVASGEAALASIAQRAPDLILLDIKMPGMDGYQVASALKKDPGTANIPIIVVTVLPDRDARVAALKVGVEEFVTKPIDPSELSLRVRNLLRLKEAGDVTGRKRTELELQRFRAAMDISADAIVLVDRKSMRYLDVNQTLCDMAGLTREKLMGMAPMDLMDGNREALERDYDAVIADSNSAAAKVEGEFRRKDGSTVLIETRRRALHTENGWVIVGIVRDITAQTQTEARITRQNRVYAMLSGITTLTVRAHDRDELFREACRIAIEHGKYLMAWVGLVDREAGVVRPIASAGDVRDFLEVAPLGINEAHASDFGPVGHAVRDLNPKFRNDAERGLRQRMRPHFVERGIGSHAIIPLLDGKKAIGVLAFYAADPNAFDEQEVQLLQELAGNVAFAMAGIERAAKLERVTRVNAILSGINGAIVHIRDRKQLFQEVCRIAVETGGLPFCWLCMVDVTGSRLEPVGHAGRDSGFAELIVDRLSLSDDAPDGYGISARSVREKRAIRVSNIALSAHIKHKQRYADRGINSSAAFPLIVAGQAIGSLALNAAEVDFFDDEEMKLLEEVAGNIAFALEHIEKEEKVRRLTRVYAVLSGINTLIVRVQDREELFNEACRIAVEDGRFTLAWIGVVDREAMQVRPVATAGLADGFFDTVRPRLSLTKDAAGIMGGAAQAISEKRAVVIDDVTTDPRVARRKEHLERNIRSVAILPLLVSGESVGLLSLHAAEAGFFDEEEMKLLTDLAGDIAFAIDHIDKAQKLARTTRVNAVLSGINAAIVRIRDPQELYQEACRIAVETGGLPFAWICVVDEEKMRLRLAASAGADPGFLETISDRFSLRDDAPDGHGLGARSVREKRPLALNDTRSEPYVKYRESFAERGIRSTAAFPLNIAGKAVGTFALHSAETGFFDEDEMQLLGEVAGNIAFAIEHIGNQGRLDYLAYYDELTGLANRGLFLERLAQHMRSAVSGGHKLAVFFLDLERFRNINESLGRPAGDALLKLVVEWLVQNVGDRNMLARLSGDHFAIVLPKVKQDGDVSHMLDKNMRAFLDHPFRVNDTDIRLAAKVGVALFPNDGTDAETLLRNAEAALKKAKSRGDRILLYTQTMNEAVAGNLTLESQLRRALENEEFVLHFQPKGNLNTAKLTSAEALIRWNDPRTGLVPPGRFIPILEETGLIHEVGRWAMRKAVEQSLRWRAAGLPAMRIAVNVSPLQLRSPGFIAEVRQAIGIDPHAAAGLEIEITESLIMEDVKHSVATLQAIRAMGIVIAIDDFGTGFSSLSYLAKLPVDTLKIDRSFVIDMTSGPDGMALVSMIINLAHSLKLTVVAEGVETEEQSRMLRLLQCDEMQGFLFSKPVPADEFEARFLTLPLAA